MMALDGRDIQFKTRLPLRLKVRYDRRMTIAAGFMHTDGVLLCSDTQMEGGAIKFQAPKIGMFECVGGKLAFAIAGNVDFAISAVQKISDHVKDLDAELVIPELEVVHEREYRRTVFEHPKYKSQADTLAYSLLVSFWSRSRNLVFLFMTHEHIVHACYGSEFIGIGFELANVLTRPFYSDPLSEHDTLMLAAYTLAQVKNNVPGCGGASMYVSMRHDGTATPVTSIMVDQIEHVAAPYDKATRTLLFAMAGDNDDRLNKELEEFAKHSRELSEQWRKIREATPAIALYRRLTTAGSTPEPPSRA